MWNDLKDHKSEGSVISRNEKDLQKELDRMLKLTQVNLEGEEMQEEEKKDEMNLEFERILELGEKNGILMKLLVISPANYLWTNTKQKKSAEKFEKKFFEVF